MSFLLVYSLVSHYLSAMLATGRDREREDSNKCTYAIAKCIEIDRGLNRQESTQIIFRKRKPYFGLESGDVAICNPCNTTKYVQLMVSLSRGPALYGVFRAMTGISSPSGDKRTGGAPGPRWMPMIAKPNVRQNPACRSPPGQTKPHERSPTVSYDVRQRHTLFRASR